MIRRHAMEDATKEHFIDARFGGEGDYDGYQANVKNEVLSPFAVNVSPFDPESVTVDP